MAASTVSGAALGAYLAVAAGYREIRGKTRHVTLGGVWAAMAGIILWLLFAEALRAAGLVGGVAGGATLGIAIGRLAYGERLTLGEILVGVAVAALAFIAIARWAE